MKCIICGTDHNELFCPICGVSVSSETEHPPSDETSVYTETKFSAGAKPLAFTSEDDIVGISSDESSAGFEPSMSSETKNSRHIKQPESKKPKPIAHAMLSICAIFLVLFLVSLIVYVVFLRPEANGSPQLLDTMVSEAAPTVANEETREMPEGDVDSDIYPDEIDTDMPSDILNPDISASGFDSQILFMGQTGTIGDVTLQFVTAMESGGCGQNPPAEGYIYVLLEIIIQNDHPNELEVNSSSMFSAVCDGQPVTATQPSEIIEELTDLDGILLPGEDIQGVLAFELPITWDKLEIEFIPDPGNDEGLSLVLYS